MNGTLKSLLGLAGTWVVGSVTWLLLLGICAAASTSPMMAPMVSMGIAWASAVLVSVGVVVAGGAMLWRWLPQGGGRVVLLVALGAFQLATLLGEVFTVFVAFDR